MDEQKVREAIFEAKSIIDEWRVGEDGRVHVHKDAISKAINAAVYWLAANLPEQPQGKHICCWERTDPHRCILCCQCGKKFEPALAEQQGLTKSNKS